MREDAGSRWRLRWRAVGGACVLVLVAARATGAAPPATVPSLDEQAASLRAAGEMVELAQLRTWPTLPDDRNAAVALAAAAARVEAARAGGRPVLGALGRTSIAGWTPPLTDADRAELRATSTAGQEVLATLDRLADGLEADWGPAPPGPLATYRPPDAVWPHANTASHLLTLDALLAVDEADVPRAWRRMLALRALAAACATHPSGDVRDLWWHANERAADVGAWVAVAGAFDPGRVGGRPAVDAVVRAWLDEAPVRAAHRRAVAVDRLALLDTAPRLADGSLTPRLLAAAPYQVVNTVPARTGVPAWPLVVWFHTRMIEAQDAAPALTRAEVGPRVNDAQHALFGQGFVAAHVVQGIGPNYNARLEATLALRARQVLAATALAVRLYRPDHGGALPPSLDALVPAYLPRVPVDPCAADGAAIRYRREGDVPVVWSVGGNGRDDGGRAAAPGAPRPQRADADVVVPLVPATRPARE